jgi:exodeoxyribonuclease VIII
MPRIAITPETYPPDDKKWTYNAKYCKDWRDTQESAGRIVLNASEYDTLIGCVDAVRRHPEASKALSRGKSEVSLFCDVELPDGSKVATKSRHDFIPDHGDAMVDLKTTLDGGASPTEFAKTIVNRRYHVQAAAYLKRYPEARQKWCWIVVEKSAPYLVACYYATERLLDLGWQQYISDIKVYQNCVDSNNWPGYGNGWTEIDAPIWMK